LDISDRNTFPIVSIDKVKPILMQTFLSIQAIFAICNVKMNMDFILSDAKLKNKYVILIL
jgi:hypothetical protein